MTGAALESMHAIPSRRPSEVFTRESACAHALADHAILRGLAGTLNAAARGALLDEKERYSVRQLLAQLRSELERHLRFEETVLIPLLRENDENGEAVLAREHDQQRIVLDALCEDAEDGGKNIGELADEVAWYVAAFERDMAAEEAIFVL